MSETQPEHHTRWELPYLLGADTMLIPLCWGYVYNSWVGNVITVPDTFLSVALLTWMVTLAGRIWHGIRTATIFYRRYAPILLLLLSAITAATMWFLCRQVGVHMLQLIRVPVLLGSVGMLFGTFNRTMGRFLLSFALATICLIPACYLNISVNFLLGSDIEALFLLGLYFISAPCADEPTGERRSGRNHTIWLLVLGIWSGYCGLMCHSEAAGNLCYTIAGSTPIMITMLLLRRRLSSYAMQALQSPALALPPVLAYLIL